MSQDDIATQDKQNSVNETKPSNVKTKAVLCDSVSDFYRELAKDHSDYIYRGQADLEWGLIPSAWRGDWENSEHFQKYFKECVHRLNKKYRKTYGDSFKLISTKGFILNVRRTKNDIQLSFSIEALVQQGHLTPHWENINNVSNEARNYIRANFDINDDGGIIITEKHHDRLVELIPLPLPLEIYYKHRYQWTIHISFELWLLCSFWHQANYAGLDMTIASKLCYNPKASNISVFKLPMYNYIKSYQPDDLISKLYYTALHELQPAYVPSYSQLQNQQLTRQSKNMRDYRYHTKYFLQDFIQTSLHPQKVFNQLKDALNHQLSLDYNKTIPQHQGIPTRLLDWTKDPLVALFFAAYGAYQNQKNTGKSNSDKYFAVYALNTKDDQTIQKVEEHHITQNTFLHQQKGLFTVLPSGDHYFLEHGRWPDLLDLATERTPKNEDCYFEDKEQTFTLKCYKFPITKAESILNDLRKKGYSYSTLLPSYENVVEDMKTMPIINHFDHDKT